MDSTRRIALKRCAAFVAATWTAQSTLAQTKASKKAMQYQDAPKNGQECDTCMQWIPGAGAGAPGNCKVVEGPISPKGWCVAYVKKA
jgi:hypothetical protein